VLGTYPAGWSVPIVFRRDGQEFEKRVRLAAMHREGELEALLEQEHEPPVPDRPRRDGEPQPEDRQPPDGERPANPPQRGPQREQQPGDRPEPRRSRRPKLRLPAAVKPFYEAAPGYANYWFNRHHQQRVWNAYLARGDFADTGWSWKVAAQTAAGGDVAIELSEKTGTIVMPDGQSAAKFDLSLTEQTSPPRSGGLLAALHLWQRLLLVGPRTFGEVVYLGTLPWTTDDDPCDCLLAIYGGVETRFYFSPTSGDLVGLEMQLADDEDPCEVYFSDLRQVDGRALPHRWLVRHGDEDFVELTVTKYELSGRAGGEAEGKE
jgi:hypothetical protein